MSTFETGIPIFKEKVGFASFSDAWFKSSLVLGQTQDDNIEIFGK
jgi:hypothetical protein